jgi:hypothetical protein
VAADARRRRSLGRAGTEAAGGFRGDPGLQSQRRLEERGGGPGKGPGRWGRGGGKAGEGKGGGGQPKGAGGGGCRGGGPGMKKAGKAIFR